MIATKCVITILECGDCDKALEWNFGREDVQPFLLTDTKIDEGIPISHHNNHAAALSWRTCYDKFSKRSLFKPLRI